MINEKSKLCKSKGCYNPVLDGEYCEYCKQTKKEKNHKIKTALGSATILALGIAIKKGAIKHAPKFAKKVIKVIFRA